MLNDWRAAPLILRRSAAFAKAAACQGDRRYRSHARLTRLPLPKAFRLAPRKPMRILGVLAHVAELADAYGSGPYGETRGGSSPLVSIPME